MSSQAIRIPKELKQRMAKYNVNWNKMISEFVNEKLKELERLEHAKRGVEILKSLEFSYDGVKEVVKNRNSR